MKKMANGNGELWFCYGIVFLFLLTIFGIIYHEFKEHEKLEDFDACTHVGGTNRQCLQLAYPEEWAEYESRRNKMRELLKKN